LVSNFLGRSQTPNYTFSARLVRLVGAGCQKSGLNLKILLKSMVLAPLGPPTKRSVNFFDYHCEGKVFTNMFYAESLFPMCFV